MARTQTMVQLTEDLVAELDQEAARRGMSRSALVREAVVAQLAGGRQRRLTEAIVAGYRRIPPATPDEWGDLAHAADGAVTETAKRMDAEEREAGLGPW